MTFETIAIATDARGVATLTLNRSEKRNALSARMIAELTEATDLLAGDRSIRIVILTGAGAIFCAGGDLAWMKEQTTASRAQRLAEARKLALMLKALNELPKPLIGRVNGPAYGGGVGMMSVCDVAFGAEDATFGLTEARLGLIPATIAPYVIARMGEGAARRAFLSARRFGAAEAVHLGLLAQAVPAAELDRAVEAEAEAHLACSPEAAARAKALVRGLGPVMREDVVDWTATQLADAWETPDATEGVAAFFEKRKPNWV